MIQPNLFLSQQHPASKRWAVLEDNGTSAWFYLTEPKTKVIVADVFVYNRIAPISLERVQDYRNGPPPIAVGYAGAAAYLPHPNSGDFQLHWSKDGRSVAVLKGGVPVAYVFHTEHNGYSKNIAVEGPWGHVWNQAHYDKAFHP